MLRSLLSGMALVLLPGLVVAQGFVEDSTLRAFKGSLQQHLAWAGGLNNPELNKADLNNDGVQDLVIYDWSTAQVKTFINKGTPGNPHYEYQPRYARNFPPCRDYLRMADYNNDGIQDLFEKGCCGFQAYKGRYNAANELVFDFYRELRYVNSGGSVNAYTQAGDIPGIADVDGDGDLDFFGYDVNGAILSFYRNCRVENGLPADSIRICFPNSCWGQFRQPLARTYELEKDNCPAFALTYCNKPTLHPGNVMELLDYDGDGDMDFLDGNTSFSDIQLLINGRAQFGGPDSMVSQDTLFQAGGHQLYLPLWPVPHWLDWDNDGDKDLLFTPHAQNTSENIRTVQLYSNAGSDAAPSFVYQSDTFFSRTLIDAGGASFPLFYDYNRDGRPDLFVGGDGAYQDPGQLLGKVLYYQSSAPGELAWATNDFNAISLLSLPGARPAIGDLDNDGKDDLVIGHNDGTLSFYANTAATAAAQPVWQLAQFRLHRTTGDSIDAGSMAAPFIYDLNKDGRPDLLIGNQAGRVHFYKNLGGSGVQLEFQTAQLGGMIANPENPAFGFSTIYAGPIDSVTGTHYILLGSDSGAIRRYTGFQGGDVTGPYTQLDTAFGGIAVGLRSAPALADADGDGLLNMMVGNKLGGVFQYRYNLNAAGIAAGVIDNASLLRAYPNPAGDVVRIDWREARDVHGGSIVLTNALGSIVCTQAFSAGDESADIRTGDLPNGLYQLSLYGSDGARYSTRLAVVH